MAAQAGIDERIRELVGQHRPELEQLVDQALERELNLLLEQRLDARNGTSEPEPALTVAPISYPQVGNAPAAATKVCDGCGETKPETEFEKYRRRCRDCRRRDRRATAVEQAPAEPGRPAAIEPSELAERARVDSRPAAPDLTSWLVDQELALEVDGLLTPTARGVALGAGIN